MSIDTNLNTSPYFDDFDIEKNFHRILFKPGVAVQARELTQLQTILQNQLERFGNNVLKEGTIISGGNFVENSNLSYVKINDNNTDGNAVVMSSYEGKYAVGAVTGLRAQIETTLTGFESQSPLLNTLYVKYLGTNNGNKVFNSSENLEIQEADGTPIETVTVAGTADAEPIGIAYGVRCGDGIIFQKGHFIRFTDNQTIVSRYTNMPDDVVIGFTSVESIVNSNVDESLLDNAQGFNNENAPGADRLKIEPKLITLTKAEAAEDDNFFAIQEYRFGSVIRRRLTTVYNTIQTLIEQRSSEENGNFIINRFPLRVSSNSSNTSLNNIHIGPGLAYIEGRRVESVSEDTISISKATDTNTIDGQTVVANYGNYIECANLAGAFDINTFETVNLVDAGANTIGTATIRSIVQTDADEFNVYVFNTTMSSGESFESVREITNGSGASADVVLSGAGNAVLNDFSYKRAVFPLGKDAVKNLDLADTTYRYRSANTNAVMTTGGTLTLNLPAGDTFPYTVSSTLNDIQKLDLTLVSTETQAPYTSGDVINILGANSVVTVTSSSQLTVQMAGSFPAAAMDVTAYHIADRDVTTVSSKVLDTVFVKIDTATHAGGTAGTYSLGVPDVFDIQGIYIGGTYDANNTNYSSSFNLFKNSKDTHYGLSFIAPAGSNPISASDKILIEARVFRNTSGVNTFFSVDSYPIDDVTSPTPANKIRTEDIPIYKTDSGERISLRDAVDLRPYAANTAAYANTSAGATENPSDVLDFGSSNLFFIGPNEAVTTNFDYYLGRIDRIVLDYRGNFYIVPGQPADAPIAPPIPDKVLSPATVTVGAYPSIPIGAAARADRNEYSVYITRVNNDNYYPEDIRALEGRIRNLEEYTALTLLESKATDTVIQDANGLNRFKNGILVDSFKNFAVSNIEDSQYTVSLDPSTNELLPRFRAHGLDLKTVSTSNTTEYARTATLTNVPETMIEQQFASSQKNCTTDFWKFTGTMSISPEADTGVDTVRSPDITRGSTNGFRFSERLTELMPQVRPSVPFTDVDDIISNTSSTQGGISRNTVLGDTFADGDIDTDVIPNGAFVADIRFDSFMRSRDIEVVISGMRPNTQVYFYFDGDDVNTAIAPAQVVNSSLRRSGDFGDDITSDASGVVTVIFRLPANTFYVGDRKLEVFDINLYNSLGNATTYASRTYTAFNLATAGPGTPAPRPPSPPAAAWSPPSPGPVIPLSWNQAPDATGGAPFIATLFGVNDFGSQPWLTADIYRDPIAQTFVIDANSSKDIVAIIPAVDLYFASKSDTNGVTLEIREVVNGYPSPNVVTYGSKHLTSAEVSANTESATVATTFTFDDQVILKTGQEYCFVCKPDANDPGYRVWISKTGEVDVDTGFDIRQDTNSGTLFTSTNDKAWTPYQDENIKFTIYKSLFTANTGSITFTNHDNEFLKVTADNSFTFTEGEYVFKDNANTYLTGNVSVTSGNTTVIGTGTLFTSEYEEGNHIVVNYPAATQVLEIGSIANNTSMSLLDIPRTDATDVKHHNSVVGKVAYYYNRDPDTLVLEHSTAKTGYVFANSDIIVGEDSGAEGTITDIMDLPVSYIQPNILQSNFSLTSTALTGSLNRVGSQYSTALKAGDNNYLSGNATYIKSRSNEITDNGGDNSFTLTTTLSTNVGDSSPMVDFDGSSVMAYEYFINNDSTSEKTNFGSAESKYVTNKVELADGLDAEDMRVFLTAYRPAGTNIEVWVKMLSATDPNDFDNCSCVSWTKLELKIGNDVTSSSANRKDFKEFEYVMGEAVLGNGDGAYLENGTTFKYTDNDGAIYTNFKFFAVKIILKSDTHKTVPRVKDMRAIAVT